MRLEKAEFAQLRPVSANFQKHCGDNVRDILEQALLKHATLWCVLPGSPWPCAV